MLAEGLGLSGIVSILFTGIVSTYNFKQPYSVPDIFQNDYIMLWLQVMKHYTFSNLSEKSQHFAAAFFHLISSLAETFV